MPSNRRATVYFSPDVHRALRLRAAATDRSISDVVNDAVRATLAEDAEDLAAFRDRASEREIPYETVLKRLRQRGRI